jgi:dCMP deaminase
VNSKWDARFLELARLVSTWSKDPSTKTGAALVAPDKRVVSVGFNGFPRAMYDKPEFYADRDTKLSRVVHCEINALIFAREPLHNTTLYTWPFMSCDRCVVQMLQAGVTHFVAPQPTQDQLARWGAAFIKTKAYIEECGATWKELELD